MLLTHDDLRVRKRYLNARNTLLVLLQYGVVPVINENDTVSVDEIRSATTTCWPPWCATSWMPTACSS